jgi:hypothetical protein
MMVDHTTRGQSVHEGQVRALEHLRRAQGRITVPMIDMAIEAFRICPGCGYQPASTEHQIVCVEGRTSFELKEVRDGTQAGGTQPPAESQESESMGVQR